jgi:hypothetical protein
MKVLDIIRKARKTFRDSMNKIEVIRVIREARPDIDLKGAKDFWEWIERNGDGLSAPRLACHWCVEHWQDNEICGCPEGVEVVAEESELQGKGDAANGGSCTQSKRSAVHRMSEHIHDDSIKGWGEDQMSKLQRRTQSTMADKEASTRGAVKGQKLLSGTRDQLIQDLQRVHKVFPTAVPDRDFYRVHGKYTDAAVKVHFSRFKDFAAAAVPEMTPDEAFKLAVRSLDRAIDLIQK